MIFCLVCCNPESCKVLVDKGCRYVKQFIKNTNEPRICVHTTAEDGIHANRCL